MGFAPLNPSYRYASTFEFPDNRENNREFSKFAAILAIPVFDYTAIPKPCTQIP
jgi:hypothetical protein